MKFFSLFLTPDLSFFFFLGHIYTGVSGAFVVLSNIFIYLSKVELLKKNKNWTVMARCMCCVVTIAFSG